MHGEIIGHVYTGKRELGTGGGDGGGGERQGERNGGDSAMKSNPIVLFLVFPADVLGDSKDGGSAINDDFPLDWRLNYRNTHQ